MNNEIKNDLPEKWPKWVSKIVRDLEASENMTGEFLLKGAPGWVPRIWIELIKLMFPKAKPDDYKESGIRFTGAILGHQQALLKGKNGLEKQYEKMTQAFEWMDEELRKKLSAKAYSRLVAESERLWPVIEKNLTQVEKMLVRKEKAIKSALRLASEQTFEEQVDFFDAYSRAMNTEIYTEQDRPRYEKMSSTTTIYVLMTIYWPFIIKKIRAVPVLHTWLCSLIGETQVGNLDRVKGICRRFGIVLTHRGRPRKK